MESNPMIVVRNGLMRRGFVLAARMKW